MHYSVTVLTKVVGVTVQLYICIRAFGQHTTFRELLMEFIISLTQISAYYFNQARTASFKILSTSSFTEFLPGKLDTLT